MAHMIKDCLPHQLRVTLFILILSDQVWPAIKPYSFQHNSLANSLSRAHTPSASSQGTDILKRQGLKQSEAGKEQVSEGRGSWTFLKWEGPKKKMGLDLIQLRLTLREPQEQEQHMLLEDTFLYLNHSRTGSKQGWEEPGYRQQNNQGVCLQYLHLSVSQVFTKVKHC